MCRTAPSPRRCPSRISPPFVIGWKSAPAACHAPSHESPIVGNERRTTTLMPFPPAILLDILRYYSKPPRCHRRASTTGGWSGGQEVTSDGHLKPRWQHYPPRTRPDRRRPTCRGSRSPRGRRTFTTSSNRFRRGTLRSSASASGVSAPPLKCLRRSYLLTAQRARDEE